MIPNQVYGVSFLISAGVIFTIEKIAVAWQINQLRIAGVSFPKNEIENQVFSNIFIYIFFLLGMLFLLSGIFKKNQQ